jgi:FixJ family two-component response regulator
LGRQRLTAREHKVALLLAQGLTNRHIAERLVLSERTADAHIRNIFGWPAWVPRFAAWFRLPTRVLYLSLI